MSLLNLSLFSRDNTNVNTDVRSHVTVNNKDHIKQYVTGIYNENTKDHKRHDGDNIVNGSKLVVDRNYLAKDGVQIITLMDLQTQETMPAAILYL
mmetsp:Transcript_2695/g.4557  ORF Transcript_2695/g.4557 Transcript_2695/m.4557 type:complete len:95 (-) Transcript_2695:158-442(-)